MSKEAGAISCLAKATKHASLLDLSSLDFSLSEPAVEEASLSIGLNERGVTPGGLCHITRALTSVRLTNATPLTELHLAYNKIGDDGVASIAWAAMQGALLGLVRLVLTGNRLTRLSSLATACRAGELPSLQVLYLSSNALGGAALADLASANDATTGASALRGLVQLWLDHNVLGSAFARGGADGGADDGEMAEWQSVSVGAVGAIARACPALRVLELSSNSLRDAHLDALTSAIATPRDVFVPSGACAGAARLEVSLNNTSFRAMRRLEAACAAHGGVRLVA